MPRTKRIGSNPPMPNYGNPPQDATRVVQNQSYPPDQSIYSNPITSNQYTSNARTPSTSQAGAAPNMQLGSTNSLPTSQLPQTTDGVNPLIH